MITTENQIVYKGMSTPWGKAQEIDVITPWLGCVSTAGHGGYKVAPQYNRFIPASVRKVGGWYEEDCAWAIPFTILAERIRMDVAPAHMDYINRIIREKTAIDTFKCWYWREYEEIFDTIVKLTESRPKAEYVWKSQNAGKWQIISASTLDNGDVKIWLTVDGDRTEGVAEKIVVLSKEDYKKSLSFGNLAAFDSIDLIVIAKEIVETTL